MLKLIKTVILSLFLLIPTTITFSDTTPLSKTQIKTIIEQRIDKHKKSVGIAIGFISPTENKILTRGKLSLDAKTDISEQTFFEIGSISKVFTTLLLADMVEKGEVKLDDPISKYLPKSVKTPTKNGKEITLLHLATHTSGLSRLPTNLIAVAKDFENPYADYTQEHLYQFLSNYTLTREIGAEYEYSNLGMGILGHILSLHAATSYENLLVTRICKPLQMHDTKILLSSEDKLRLAHGHDQKLIPTKNWDFAVLSGAGAIRSTLQDLLKFATAYLNISKTELSNAMQKSLAVYNSSNIPNIDVALGWHLSKDHNRQIFWHSGQTGGYHSYISFDKNSLTAVVILSNSTNDIDDIGRHLMESQFNLITFDDTQEHKAIKLDDPQIFDAYVGQYEITPDFILTISRQGEHFFVQATKQPKFEIFPESKQKFFLTQIQAQIEFLKDHTGQVIQLILHQNGNSISAKKIK